ncbi:Glyoxalase-like domain-containing protein [Streptoalloteichus tenebrarius]|uniref:Glyoxalase-like domain-containing protein n=1 Tax=Streptoalloteichus tenebrarius (strain ATCC 17920 / DSM 40477 / JCM 4838 / CBS 697.72 / NBRC 16177 / NCIMB 11028 / NRRL B-12390 / A12253. 1 / ISP 5477) TaxID=1933 RepID=A0ABT1HV83_STRSD|nr:VOC family protein [Streptoalloteichus tenebrarius]MCP2259444.1 Glyoxalase-like domain-containing protein [Streptoalloteichus tenebrarius]BFF02386.1 VOC family protein [Streptoalloteichus tenebrarius]
MSVPTRSLKVGAVVLDCPDPTALANFYSALLGWPSVEADGDNSWVTLRDPAGGPSLCFQRAADYTPPTWPDPERPQMLHLDVEVDDLRAGHEHALTVGARPLEVDKLTAGSGFNVYADPAGHPFCLVVD